MDAVQDDTKAVIVDASAMGSVDVTAAKTLRIMYDTLKEKGVKLYITEHIGQLNVQAQKAWTWRHDRGRMRETDHGESTVRLRP